MKIPSPKRLGIAGAIVLVLGIFIEFVLVPPIVKFAVKRKLSLKNGWPMRDIWTKLPFVIENHVYIFNVTNHVEIAKGAKPIVRQVGPFVYDMYQEKVKQTDNEKDDTLSYVLENTYYYNKKKSNGLSDEVEVYFPHLFILTLATGPLRENPAKVSFTSRAVDSILNNPESLFYKLKVKDILFDGLPIPCGGIEEYFGKLICTEISAKYSDSLPRKGDTYYVSLYGFRNGTSIKEKRIQIQRGSKKLQDLGKIIDIDGRTNLSIWKNDKCNAFAGTDGTIFPPLMSRKKKKDISLVYPMICRRLALTYDSETKYNDIKLMRYTGDLGTDGENVPEDKCYCPTPDTCLRKGMFDTFRCINVPIVISNPHFYNADPYYLTTVDGLQPNKEKHLTHVDFDPLTGSPIHAHVRAQFNMEFMPIEKFRLMRNFSYAMMPLIWQDEIVNLPEFFILKIEIGYGLLKLAEVIEYLLMSCGSLMCLVAGFLEYRARNKPKVDEPKSATTTSNEITVSENTTQESENTTTAESSANNNVNSDNNIKKYNIRRLLSAIRPAPLPPAAVE